MRLDKHCNARMWCQGADQPPRLLPGAVHGDEEVSMRLDVASHTRLSPTG